MRTWIKLNSSVLDFWIVFSIASVLAGCQGPEDRAFKYDEASLTQEQAAKLIRTIDSYYAPPRTAERVSYSLLVAMRSISPESRDEVLWRAGRACVWLAEYLPKRRQSKDVAIQGVKIGIESTREDVDKVEPYFFYALNLAMLTQIDATSRHIPTMEKLCKRAIEIDETYDYAGPHRFLGLLYYRTQGQLIGEVGTLEDALQHLQRACELAPEYPLNHLAYGQALIEDDQIEKARVHLDKVLNVKAPPGEEQRYKEWVEETHELFRELAADSP